MSGNGTPGTPGTRNAQSCQRPGCDGAYEDMGGGELYCDVCGLAPVVSPEGLITSPPTGVTGGGSHPSGTAGPSGRSASSRASRSSRRSVSGRLSGSLSGSSTARSVSVRSSGTSGSSAASRPRLGAGLVTVPPIPREDPASLVLENAEVPERKRFCGNGDCAAPVGRSRGSRPGRTEGFCTKCGQPYSFVPKLRRGDLVHGQYEIVGCLAHGGLGWIYLALDLALSRRPVVLKGLLDTGDQDAMAAAISERRFLAEIEHPSIVGVINFVEHLDRRTGSLDGYIVMEYVGGKSLKQIANERRTPDGRRDPLPVDQACAYGLEALEALGYLHSRNLVYCDFKVDNAIQQVDRLILIDMGAVRHMNDEKSAVYGTVGYQAPEVADVGPSVASDLYTVARTLAVLTFDFGGYTTTYADSLPDPGGVEVFQRYESFYRLLVRATDPDPGQRFSSAGEMAEQLTGVLREVVALQTGRPRPALSTLFGTETRVTDTQLLAPTGGGDVSVLGARAPLSRRARRAAAPAGGGSATGTGGTGHASGPGARTLGPGNSVPLQAGSTPGGPAPSPSAGQTSGTPLGGTGPGTAGPAAGGGLAPWSSGGQRTAAGGGAGQAVLPAQRAGEAAAAGSAVRTVALRAADAALALPVPLVDASDPNAGFLAGLMAPAPAEALAALRAAPADSLELRLRSLRAELELSAADGTTGTRGRTGRTGPAEPPAELLTALEARHDGDWRVVWYRGLTALVEGDLETAALAFDAVYDAFPGESAPKLALGVCAELLGQLDNAVEYYRLVWFTDTSYVSAAFGLARVDLAAGDRAGAVAALESVPEASTHFTAARVAAVRARLRGRAPHEPLLEDLEAAGAQVERLGTAGLDAVRREELTVEVLGCALDWLLAGRAGAPPGAGRTRLLGCPLEEGGLRLGLERSYRRLARLAQSGTERIDLVERANRLRPRTWV